MDIVGIAGVWFNFITDFSMEVILKSTIAFPRFDAELDTDVCSASNNAELTLTLKLGFTQINPAAGAAEGTHNDFGDATKPARKTIKWTATEWANWKANFLSSAQAYWNGKFWLVNDSGSFQFFVGTQTYVPNIYCKFKLVGSDGAVGNHHNISVVRLHASESWFGSHSTLYDSKDTNSVKKGTDSAGKKIMQQAHVHEVGHLLGLGHVDIGKAHCPAASDTNLGPCYGVADADKNSVMGQGMQLRDEHAEPWREAARAFSLKELLTAPAAFTPMLPFYQMMGALPKAFNMFNAVWPAKRRRHYPRTLAEAQAGTMVTSFKRAA